MRKIILSLLSLPILAGIFASCSEDSFELSQQQSAESSLYVKQLDATIKDFVCEDMDGSASGLTTRTAVVEEDGGLQFVWAENDTIGIFPNQGFQVAFPMAGGAGTKSASFDGGGWGLKATATYSAYYPLIGQFYLDKTKIPLTLTGQTQKENANSDHIGAYDYMAAINATVKERGNVEFDFEHLVSILHMQFKMPHAGTFKTLILESSGSFVTEATLDLTTGAITPTKTSAIQMLNLDNVTTTGDEYLEVYMAILPVNMSGNALYAKIYDEDGVCHTATLEGKDYQAGTFYNIGRKAVVDVLNTGLPVVLINTPNNESITSKTDWMKKASITILKADGTVDMSDESLQIRGRGNTTWSFPKKPYALKFSNKTKVLGMPAHKRWVLLANWMDRTLLRNDVAFQISKQTGLAWTPRGQFVEVVLNGTHVGNYYLCEQIRVDKNRVNIVEMTANDIEGDAVTGGYLMELDVYYDEVNKFYSSVKVGGSASTGLPYMFKTPDEEVLQTAQFDYFQNYINDMETKLYSDDWLTNREYTDYMDLESFIDWWFIHELAMNREPYWPKSTYMHKDRLGKLKAGPVWDFDYATFVPNKAEKYQLKNELYYGRLFSDPTFVSLVKERWALHKPKFDQIPDYIREQASKIKESNDINIELWPITSSTVNGDETMTFEEAIDRMISAYQTKLNWLNTKISGM